MGICSALDGYSGMVPCQLRVQWFWKGKMREIKGRGGGRKHQVGISHISGTPRLQTQGLSNNLNAKMCDIKQVHPSKDDPKKARLVIESSHMAFWVTIADA